MPIEKCVGRIVELIYQDGKGRITKRRIAVSGVAGGIVKGYDTAKHAYRTFSLERILAAQPLVRGR